MKSTWQISAVRGKLCFKLPRWLIVTTDQQFAVYLVAGSIKKINKSRNSVNECCATFSSQNVKIENERFTGANLTAVFGEVKYDLRNAIIDSDVVINASSTFGGIEIYVPCLLYTSDAADE